MPIPDFVRSLRKKIGTDELWLPGVTAVIIRDVPEGAPITAVPEVLLVKRADNGTTRSEERRVGKECRSRWSPYH